MKTKERLEQIQLFLKENDIFAWLELGSDPHASEYISEQFRIRQYCTGFTGSAGTVIITQTQVYLWVDFRYYIQVEDECKDEIFTIFKQGQNGVPSWNEWLSSNLPAQASLAFDENRITLSQAYHIESSLKHKQTLYVGNIDLFSHLKMEIPAAKVKPVYALGSEVTDLDRTKKFQILREFLDKKDVDATLLTRLDEVAWTLNLRGYDIENSSVFYSYFYISKTQTILFVSPQHLSDEMRTQLNDDGVQILEYNAVFDHLASLHNLTLFLDPEAISVSLKNALSNSVIVNTGISPAYVLKASKSHFEQENLRQTCVIDSLALLRFYHWLESQYQNKTPLDEIICQDQLESFRKENPEYISNSFDTISAFGPNAALCHYRSDEQTNQRFSDGMYLLDSGGQYRRGTTDFTRTVYLGDKPSEQQKKDYTLVLKGHIALSRQAFPQGTKGYQLDILARQFLWQEGLDYGHGTGHGIGYCLDVHEGPQRISPQANNQSLLLGMICSNEPGIYRENEYGIRIENLLVVQENPQTHNYFFETLNFLPYDKKLIEKELLTAEEISWINDYHQRCYQTLSATIKPDQQSLLDFLRNNTSAL